MHSTRHRTKLHKQKEKMNTEPDELKMQKRFPCAVPRKSLAGPFSVSCNKWISSRARECASDVVRLRRREDAKNDEKLPIIR